MKLSVKLALSMGVLTSFLAALGLYMLMEMANVNNVSTVMAQRTIPGIVDAERINRYTMDYHSAVILYVFNPDPALRKEYESDMAENRGEAEKKLGTLERQIISEESRRQFTETRTALQAYFSACEEHILKAAREGKSDEAVRQLLNYEEDFEKLDGLLNDMADGRIAVGDAMSREGDLLYGKTRSLSLCLIALAVGVAVALTILIVRNVARRLGKDPGELDHIARRVVDGDYDVDDGSAKRGVYGAIVQMVTALKGNIENARRESENAREQSEKAQAAVGRAEAAGKDAQAKARAMLAAADRLEAVGNVLSSASTQLAAQIEQSDRSAGESATRLSEAATAMNEMNATVQEVARNAGSASSASAETREKAESGARVVEKAVHSIGEVRRMSMEVKDDMARLNEQARSITQILGVISDIADQTNLLALNAAIEAARAGDAGRGFAVVADEVRNLAEKTMASTRDVDNAITAIQESTAKSAASVDKAVAQIEEATEFANQSGAALEEIVATVETTADQVNAIATASEEQSSASEEINQSIIQVNDMSRQTAVVMGEAARAVAELSAQARSLNDLIRDLKAA